MIAEYVAAHGLRPAVVCEVGWVNGLGAIRSLGRMGVPVISVDHRSFALGFRSRFGVKVRAPDPLSDPRGFVKAMIRLGDELGEATPVFPTHDEHLNVLAQHRDELGGRYLCPFPSWQVLEAIQSKRYQVETAERLGLAAPATRHPRSGDEARAAAREVGYPVFVKPSDNTVFKRIYKRQAFLCETEAELDEAYRLTADYEPMVQEFVPGGDEYLWTLGTYIAEDGEVLARFSGRKLRQTRENMGSARVGEIFWDDEVVESGIRLLHELGFHGIAQVEWKRDPRTGELKLIEVNPRLWQWHGLGAACGVDVVRTAYWDLVGERRAATRSNGHGKRWAIGLMAKAGDGLAFQRLPYMDGVFALDDPGPGVVHVVRFAVNTLGLR